MLWQTQADHKCDKDNRDKKLYTPKETAILQALNCVEETLPPFTAKSKMAASSRFQDRHHEYAHTVNVRVWFRCGSADQ